MTGTLYRVVGPNFVAGLIGRDNKVVHSAPILARHIGKRLTSVLIQFSNRGWRWEKLS